MANNDDLKIEPIEEDNYLETIKDIRDTLKSISGALWAQTKKQHD